MKLLSEPDEDSSQLGLQMEVSKKISYSPENNLRLEIESITELLLTYGFSFYDLVSCSPKAEKTKKSCAKAINHLLKSPLLLIELQTTKLLPIKTIENNNYAIGQVIMMKETTIKKKYSKITWVAAAAATFFRNRRKRR